MYIMNQRKAAIKKIFIIDLYQKHLYFQLTKVTFLNKYVLDCCLLTIGSNNNEGQNIIKL